VIDDDLRQLLALVGEVEIAFHAITNVRPKKVMEARLPSLRIYDSVPEKALKGSPVSHSARYVVIR
jgi:hypothetical protein